VVNEKIKCFLFHSRYERYPLLGNHVSMRRWMFNMYYSSISWCHRCRAQAV